MSITSLSFLIFVASIVFLYYIIPKRFQWIVLLLASIVFYLSTGVKNIIYIGITSVSIYFTAIAIQRENERLKSFLKENKESLSKEDKKEHKARSTKRKKRMLLASILVNVLLLCTFKYTGFILEQFKHIGLVQDAFSLNLIAPLGISFYTFQAIGYIVDVYWENIEAEKNYFKILLFTMFFPQIIQGPISQFNQLSNELFVSHKFSYKKLSWGLRRMMWGFFKKMVIANFFASYVSSTFAYYPSYTGISTFLGAITYSVQIYADFSGYMDIVCGLCEILGIRLTENFERPYFSKSIAEYWRRWHISLGTWFKKYIYYPIGMSSWSRQLSKAIRGKFGKHIGDTLPATIALLVVWITTGLWHGASWGYIIWGLLNGIFIILSLWMEPIYVKCRQTFKLNETIWWWRAFQVIRTFILVTFIKVLPEVGSLSDGLALWKHIFSNHVIPTTLRELLPFFNSSYRIQFYVACFGVMMMFIVSMLERKKDIREYVDRIPLFFRMLLHSIMFIIIVAYGVQASWGIGGFLYENF